MAPDKVFDAVPDSVFNRGVFTKRGKVFFNTRVRNKKIEGLTYGINGNFMYNENAETYFWYDADTNQYRSYSRRVVTLQAVHFFVDPYVKYFNSKGNSHSLRNRIYYGNSDANNNQSSRYLTVYNDYQHTQRFKKVKELVLVLGITNTYSHSYGKVFSGVLDSLGTTAANQNGEYSSENLGCLCAD